MPKEKLEVKEPKEKSPEQVADEILSRDSWKSHVNTNVRNRPSGWGIVKDRKGQPDKVGQAIYDRIFSESQGSVGDSIAHRRAINKLIELGYKQTNKNIFQK